MDAIQEALFGQAPRRVGTPNQHWVFAPDQTDLFIGSVNGRRNAYATLGWWDFAEGSAVCDKVLYDLDSPAKSDRDGEDWAIFEGSRAEEPPADEIVKRMRDDPDLADEILGAVCGDARTLARRSRDDNVPVVGVFSGFGLHVHQLWEPAFDPAVAMATTAWRYIEELDLDTPDPEILGQPERICRIPNCERIADSIDGNRVEDGRPTGLFTVPLSRAELASVDVEWLLDVSHSQRDVAPPDAAQRTEMRIWEDYETGQEKVADVPPRPLDPGETPIAGDADVRWLLENLLRMPCMVERLLDDPNPDHDVRVNATVMLLNCGLAPQTVVDIYQRINWVDFDREQTAKYVKGLYRNPVSDMNCATLRGKGLCTRSEEPEDCPTFGWSGGQPEWIQ